MERSAVTPDAASQPSTPREPRGSSAQRELNTLRELNVSREYRREAWEMAMRRNKVVRWFVSWLPHRVTIILRSFLRWEHSAIVKVRQRWHRSLQLRVIGTTLVISAMMIAVLGFFLTEQIADGLLANAQGAAHTQALAGLNEALRLSDYNTQPTSNSAAEIFMMTAARALEQQTGIGNPSYYVVVGLRTDYEPVFSRQVSPSVDTDATLPPALITQVEGPQTLKAASQGEDLFSASTTLTFDAGGAPSVPAIAVGAPLGQFRIQVERRDHAAARRLAFPRLGGHTPHHLELDPARVLGVQGF